MMDNMAKSALNGLSGEQFYENVTLGHWFDERDIKLFLKYGVDSYRAGFNEIEVCDIESLIIILGNKLVFSKNQRDKKLFCGIINGLIGCVGHEFEMNIGGWIKYV